jgi:hypothetical protein
MGLDLKIRLYSADDKPQTDVRPVANLSANNDFS